jgi:Kdo2-lipid IVA lauroyltransferase/acyltransferase
LAESIAFHQVTNKLQSYLVYLACRAFLGLFRILPRKWATAIVDLLALLVFYLDWKHRHVAAVNLNIVFPELSVREQRRIARRSFQNTARNLLEVSRLLLLSRENISGLVQYDSQFGLNNLRAAQARNKGILYLTGHFSAWELLPTAHALYGYPLNFITRPLDNAYLERFVSALRQSSGNTVISKRNSARPILEKLKKGEDVGILIDQNTMPQDGIFCDLFGIPAATTTSLALFALRTDAPVLPGYLTPFRDGRYTIKFLPPLELSRSGDMSRDLESNTRLFNQVIEGIVREQPETWLWGHKRWKNLPEGFPDLYSLSGDELSRFIAEARSRKAGS